MTLVGRRMSVAREIGRTKRKRRLDIRDSAREELVVRSAIAKAQAMGVEGEAATAIVEALIGGAVRVQSEEAETYLDGQKTLVVGAGKTGAWIARFLSNRGAAVSVFDPRVKLEGYDNLESPAGYLDDADLIVIASPLGTAQEDMRLILSSSPKGVIFDVCSVKTHIRDVLKEGIEQGLKLTSAHPMFGPGVATPEGRNILLCSCGCDVADRVVRDLFERAGAKVVDVALDEHDKLIAYILGVPHLCALAFGLVTMRSSFTVDRLGDFSGPSFSKLADLASSISKESRRVYHDIQRFNPETASMLGSMATAVDELSAASSNDDPTAFAAIMDAEKEYFGRWSR
jgi:chorismate mutase/prephenate dehydrogenase